MAAPFQRFSRLVLMTTLAACALPGCSQLPKKNLVEKRGELRGQTRQIARYIEQRLKDCGAAGLSIALVDDSGVIWSDGFGWSDREARVPATPETVYRVGSLSKLLTASAVMQLDETRKLDIDEPVSDYLPEFAIKARFSGSVPITARQLLSHHAGLPGDIQQGMWSDAPFTSVTARLNQEYAAYPPGYVYGYSNLGYDVLGHAVQRVSGQRFADYMRSALFNPLGMSHSAYVETPQVRRLLARGYRDGEVEELQPIRDLPAAGLYASALDLARFAQMVLRRGEVGGRRILDVESLDEMFEVQNERVALDYDVRMGLGWQQDPGGLHGAGPVQRHGGTTLLFNSQLILLPRHRLGVVVLSNSSGTKRLVTDVAEQALRVALQKRAGVVLPEPDQVEAGRRLVAAGRGSVRPGHYLTPMGLLGVQPDSGRVKAFAVDRSLDMVAFEDGSFGMRTQTFGSATQGLRRLERLRFFTERVDGHEVMVVVENGRRKLFGDRVTAARITPDWRRRFGRYRVINADPGFPIDQVCLHEQDGLLYFSYRMPKLSNNPVAVPLAPVSSGEAVVLGIGRGRGGALQVSEGDGHVRLRYSGYQVVLVSPQDG